MLYPHSVFMYFVWIWEQTTIVSLYKINWLVFITETEIVYCAVRTESLYIILFIYYPLKPNGYYMYHSFTFTNSTFCPHSVFVGFVWISEQTAIISLYSIDWLVFITETESVYWSFNYNSEGLFVGLLPRRLGFNSSSVYMRFSVDKVAVWQVSLLVLGYFPVIIIPPVPYTHLHLQYALNRRIHSLETFRKALSEIGEYRIRKYKGWIQSSGNTAVI